MEKILNLPHHHYLEKPLQRQMDLKAYFHLQKKFNVCALADIFFLNGATYTSGLFEKIGLIWTL